MGKVRGWWNKMRRRGEGPMVLSYSRFGSYQPILLGVCFFRYLLHLPLPAKSNRHVIMTAN